MRIEILALALALALSGCAGLQISGCWETAQKLNICIDSDAGKATIELPKPEAEPSE